MREAAWEVLTSTNISADGQNKYEPVTRKFDEVFNVQRNVTLE